MNLPVPVAPQVTTNFPQADFGPVVKQKLQKQIIFTDFCGPTEPTLLVYQAHRWSPSIEEYFLKLLSSCRQYNIDVVIIAVSEKEPIKFDLSKIINLDFEILSPTFNEISCMYPVFHAKGLWACNHWLIMWVWNYYAKSKGYTRLWSYEYDIRSNGDLKALWSLDNSYDYVSSKAIHKRNVNDNSFWGPIPGFSAGWTSLKQVFRASDDFLNYLHSQFLLGYTGQDEMTLASHAKDPKGHREFIISSLDNFLSRHWSPCQNEALIKEWAYYKTLVYPPLKLFHPIK